MSTIPNPWFTSSAEVVMPSVDTAAASPFIAPGTVDAAAEPLEVYGTGPLTALLRELSDDNDRRRQELAEPFDGPDIPMSELVRRGFDPERFVLEMEPLPLFLQVPIDLINVLAAH